MIRDYKGMTGEMLDAILRQVNVVIVKTMQRITGVLPTKQGSAREEERAGIKEGYAAIKRQLKALYRYTSLASNAAPTNTYYTRILTPAVHEAYTHCCAETAENDTNKILEVLNTVSDDIQYYILYAVALTKLSSKSLLVE
jgi:hypothetical protein